MKFSPTEAKAVEMIIPSEAPLEAEVTLVGLSKVIKTEVWPLRAEQNSEASN
ncbi:hypothetical protein KW801_01830 [Candidatus Saccharibacteria bacterium]|nr:hypothetical protein [Candidatus Saccharibacteria bacterium]